MTDGGLNRATAAATIAELVCPDPADFLLGVSRLMETLNTPAHEDETPRGPTLNEFVAALMEPAPPHEPALNSPDGGDTTADPTVLGLYVIARFTRDELLAHRIRAALRRSDTTPPEWLTCMDGTRIERASLLTEQGCESTHVVLDIAWPCTSRNAYVALIDPDNHGYLNDGFLLNTDTNGLAATLREIPELARSTVRDLPLAEAHRLLTRGLATLDATGGSSPEPSSHSMWPHSRHLLHWLTTLLPPHKENGSLPTAEAVQAGFFASPYGQDLDATHGSEDEDIVAMLLEFSTSMGEDPLHWSAHRIEQLLFGWVPYEIIADSEYTRRVPHVLTRLVGYAISERGLNPDESDRVLTHIDRLTGPYLDLLRRTRSDELETTNADPVEVYTLSALDHLATRAGGVRALRFLDLVPLPEEELDLSGVAPAARPHAARLAADVDNAAAPITPPETRTAWRRFVHDLALAAPDQLTTGDGKSTAAAVAWTVIAGNRLLTPTGNLTTETLLASFDLGADDIDRIIARSEELRRSLGINDHTETLPVPGGPHLLIAEERARLIAARDALQRALDQAENPINLF